MYFFMVAHKAAMPNPVEGLLDIVEVLLVLKIFLTEDS